MQTAGISKASLHGSYPCLVIALVNLGPISGAHLKVNEGQKFSLYLEDQRSKSKHCIKYNEFLRSDEERAGLDLTQTVVGLCCKLQPCRYFICFYPWLLSSLRSWLRQNQVSWFQSNLSGEGKKEGPLICTAKQSQSFYHHLPCSFARWHLKKA